jgi:pentatricopeptide repeat protein
VLQASPKNTESAINQQQAATSSQGSVDYAQASSSQQQESSSAGFLPPSILRRVISSSTAVDAYELLQQHQQQHVVVSTADVDLLLRCSLEAGNVPLALSIYQQLRAAQRAQAANGVAAPASTWPAATLQHTETLVKGLCRQLRVNDALAVLRSIRSHGVPGSEEVRHELAQPL